MPAKDWTEQEINLLLKALVTSHLPIEAKKAVASELRKQCLGAVDDPIAASRVMLQKLGYETLDGQEQ